MVARTTGSVHRRHGSLCSLVPSRQPTKIPAMPSTEGNEPFKAAHRELQELVRELVLLREHNLQFREGDPQDKLLMFAEAALVLIVLERFVRVVLGDDATDRDTLPGLLRKVVSKGLLRLPWDDQEEAIQRIRLVRNTLLHGNYEQAAREAGCGSVAEFFKTQFAGEVEALYNIVDDLMRQIDPATGKPRDRAAK